MTDQTTRLPVRRALISVSDKTGILEFARELDRPGRRNPLHRRHLQAAQGQRHRRRGSGRLHRLPGNDGRSGEDPAPENPRRHPRPSRPATTRIMGEHGIQPIDLVVVNLYPFAATVAKPGCTLPTPSRTSTSAARPWCARAAKNHADVGIVVNAGDYAACSTSLQGRRPDLCAALRPGAQGLRAHRRLRRHDRQLPGHHRPAPRTLATAARGTFPRTFNSQFVKAQDMRYGENPHQSAAFYVEAQHGEACVATARQLQGKELSLQQHRRHRCRAGVREELRQAGLRHRQARQPLRRGRGTDAKAASARPTTWPTPPTPNPPSAASSPSTASWMPPPPRPSSTASSSK